MKKYSYLYEIPACFAFLFWMAQVFYPASPAFYGIAPHPFWFVIVLFSLRYGLVPGLLSGSLAAVLYVVFIAFMGDSYRLYDFEFYVLPGLFVFVGGILGLVGKNFKQNLQKQELENQNLQSLVEQQKLEITFQKEINAQLEKKVVSKTATLITLYEGARRFDSQNIDQLESAILDFICQTLESSKGLLCVFKEETWEIKTQLGFEDAPHLENIIEVLHLLQNKKQCLNLPQLLKQESLQKVQESQFPILIGPLFEGEEGNLYGAVLLYDIPFQTLGSATLNVFNFLLLWASRSLKRSLDFTEGQKLQILDPHFSQFFSQKYFESRLEEEFSRAKTYYLPLSVGYLKIENLHVLNEKQKELFLQGVAQLLKQSLRPMDVAACFANSEYQFGFLLITTSASQADQIKINLKNNLTAFVTAWKKEFEELKISMLLSHFVPHLQNLEQWKKEMQFEVLN